MDTAAETLVGRADYDEAFLLVGLDGFGLCFFENCVGGLSVASRVHHGTLGSGEFGGGDDFHCLGDFFDVADGLEAAFDFAEGGITGGIGGDGPVNQQNQLGLTQEVFVVLFSFNKLAR